MDCSEFFQSHEVIGSSLLFVHDKSQASIWLIDFAKTVELPQRVVIDHNSAWTVGNHEDGYLIGINNLIDIFTELLQENNSNSIETEPQSTNFNSTVNELSVGLSKTYVESSTCADLPSSAQRSSATTPSIVKTNSTQQIIILDNSKLVNNLIDDTFNG